MSAPAERIKTAMAPVMSNDFAVFIEGLCESIAELDSLVRDSDDGPGWSAILDLDRCPDNGLKWLAQTVGVTIVEGLTPAAQRARIAAHVNWKRGSPAAIVAAAQLHLTGNKTVVMRERYTGSAWKLSIVTYTAETPDSAQTLADILEQKPAGIVLTYSVLDGQDFQTLLDNHALFSNVYADYATFEGVVEDIPGT